MASSSTDTNKSVFLDEHREVFAIGDIHGDMDALIICLRDCCKVIRKKREIPFDNTKKDRDLVNLMNMMTTDGGYRRDLNYEWIGRDKIIVFTGDLIDNYRNPTNIHDTNKHVGEYPLEEVKIYLFLIEMRTQALRNNCEILLVLGNHEVLNLFSDVEITSRYTSPLSKETKIIYDGKTYDRINFFSYNNVGSHLIGFSGFRFFVIINNILFIHSGIPFENPINYALLNNYGSLISKSVQNSAEIETNRKEIIEFIMCRDQSDYDDWKNRHTVYEYKLDRNAFESEYEYSRELEKRKAEQNERKDLFCERTNSLIQNFCENESICGRQNILVVGHEVQSDLVAYRKDDMHVTTKIFTEVLERTSSSTEYIQPESSEHTPPFNDVYTHEFESNAGENFKYVPGVNVECLHTNTNYASIYRIDIGMSRAFDIGGNCIFINKTAISKNTKFFDDFAGVNPLTLPKYSNREVYDTTLINEGTSLSEYIFTLMRARSPTVLHIKFEPKEQITAIRSTLRNTLIHQPRMDNMDYPRWMIEEFLHGDFRTDTDLQ